MYIRLASGITQIQLELSLAFWANPTLVAIGSQKVNEASNGNHGDTYCIKGPRKLPLISTFRRQLAAEPIKKQAFTNLLAVGKERKIDFHGVAQPHLSSEILNIIY